MPNKKVIELPTRRLVVELDIRVPDSGHTPRNDGRGEFQKAVAEAVRRELQRTERR